MKKLLAVILSVIMVFSFAACAGKSVNNEGESQTCSYEYEAVPLFWSFVQIGNGRLTSYYFSNQAQILFGL